MSKNPPEKDPIISTDKKKLNSARRIGKTQYYTEANISSSRTRFYTNQLFEFYNLQDAVSITVHKKAEE